MDGRWTRRARGTPPEPGGVVKVAGETDIDRPFSFESPVTEKIGAKNGTKADKTEE